MTDGASIFVVGAIPSTKTWTVSPLRLLKQSNPRASTIFRVAVNIQVGPAYPHGWLMRFSWSAFAVEVDHHEGQVGGGDAADAARLAETDGSNPRQLLLRLHAELGHGGKIELLRNAARFERLKSFDLLRLLLDVTCVLCLDRHLLDHIG